MVARIQNLYLFLAGLLAVAGMFFPFWSFSAGQLFFISDFSASAIAEIRYSIACYTGSVFSPLTAIVSIASIFLYKNRALQTRLIQLGALFFLGDLLSALTAAHFMNQYFLGIGTVPAHRPEAGFFMLLPEPVLFWMALQGVKKDDKIANAYKRL